MLGVRRPIAEEGDIFGFLSFSPGSVFYIWFALVLPVILVTLAVTILNNDYEVKKP